MSIAWFFGIFLSRCGSLWLNIASEVALIRIQNVTAAMRTNSFAIRTMTVKRRKSSLVLTRKYPLRGYILGVLTHTTAWDRHWGGDETLKLVLVYFA